jgi:3-oxoacyl-[acyl-carrier protein] reductase
LQSTRQFLDNYRASELQTSVLINNVGPYSSDNLTEITPEKLQWLYQTNFFTPFTLIHHLLEDLKKNKGSIINIGFPELHAIRARKTAPGYTLAKQSLFALTKSLAKELCCHHVRVNMISPGYLPDSVDIPNQTKLPQNRPVHFREIVAMVRYLLSESGRSITGQNISIAGGVGL